MTRQTPSATATRHADLRPNVAAIIYNNAGQVLLAKRAGQPIWQFPQGGIQAQESSLDALYRELGEELRLRKQDLEHTATTKKWHNYYLPKSLIKQPHKGKKKISGQTQRWFLLHFVGQENTIRFDAAGAPELDDWMWTSYWFPLTQVAYFKYHVYRSVLLEFRHAMPVVSI